MPPLVPEPDQTVSAQPARHSWRRALDALRAYLRHEDPLAELGNDVALLVGSHLPFWPLYLLWSAGPGTLPFSLITMSFTPAFCLIPLLTRRGSLAGRVGVVLVGTANTVLSTWVLGRTSGTELFLLPCAALAAMLFRRDERVWMVSLGLLPIAVWYGLQAIGLPSLEHLQGEDARAVFALNAVSVVVLMVCYGWLLGNLYARLERHAAR